ncbi:hypothetical protein M8C21_020099 [Ambrosia artemisiifolia]|uniref:Bet v I/Major latex protein domain-containing protein n=1 Tax=Ambrosia artemisiifolia TaxID=4212 RepID=A0AAD5CLS5_AMBAR|nr:hypothetical protein M8C21_020099 [Ambrosia artemisiifolia]
MTSVTVEVEVPSQFPAELVFKVFSDFDNIAPKVNPQVFKSIETVEGNGDVGTIKIFTFGDAVPFTTGKYKVDAIDASNYSYSYSFIEGDNLFGILDSINHHVKVVPSPDGGITVEVEVPSKFPAEQVFKVFSDFDNIAPKVNPQVFKSIETVEGNGDVGTIKIFTFGDAVPFTTGKYKVDALDASNHSYSYSFIEGDNLFGILDSINHHIKVVPSPDGGIKIANNEN